MKVITLRSIPPELAREISARAEQRGTSVSRTILKILEEYFSVGGTGPSDCLHHDLDDLAGAWTAEEALAFDRALNEQRPIDLDAWQ